VKRRGSGCSCGERPGPPRPPGPPKRRSNRSPNRSPNGPRSGNCCSTVFDVWTFTTPGEICLARIAKREWVPSPAATSISGETPAASCSPPDVSEELAAARRENPGLPTLPLTASANPAAQPTAIPTRPATHVFGVMTLTPLSGHSGSRSHGHHVVFRTLPNGTTGWSRPVLPAYGLGICARGAGYRGASAVDVATTRRAALRVSRPARGSARNPGLELNPACVAPAARRSS
jgi:hypothetical protein